MSKAHTYVVQSLAHAGFALVDGEVAAILRPDLWHDGIQSTGDIAEAIRNNSLLGLRDVTWGVAGIEGIARPVPVVARNTDALATRIAWVTGRKVTSLEQGEPPVAKPRAPADAAVARSQEWLAAQKLAALKALAAKEPPEHHCTLRTEILKAREELARLAEAA